MPVLPLRPAAVKLGRLANGAMKRKNLNNHRLKAVGWRLALCGIKYQGQVRGGAGQ